MRYLKTGLILFVLLFATSAYAGFGIHVGMDMTTIDERLDAFNFNGDPAGTPLTTLARTESSKPLNFGIDLTFNMLPIVDLQLSLEGAWAKYDVVISPAGGLGALVEEKDVPYARMGGDLSALVNVPGLSFPPKVAIVKVFVGGGLSFAAFGPVVSEELLVDNIDNAMEPIDPVDLAKEIETKFGLHGIFGIKIAPPASPISLRITGKYYHFMSAAEDTPDGFMTFQAGIYLF